MEPESISGTSNLASVAPPASDLEFLHRLRDGPGDSKRVRLSPSPRRRLHVESDDTVAMHAAGSQVGWGGVCLFVETAISSLEPELS